MSYIVFHDNHSHTLQVRYGYEPRKPLFHKKSIISNGVGFRKVEIFVSFLGISHHREKIDSPIQEGLLCVIPEARSNFESQSHYISHSTGKVDAETVWFPLFVYKCIGVVIVYDNGGKTILRNFGSRGRC